MWVKIREILSYAGVRGTHNQSESRQIVLANRFGIIAALITALCTIILFWSDPNDAGWPLTRVLLIIGSLLFLAVLMLNHMGLHELAKWFICWLPVILIIGVSLIDKTLYRDTITIQDFFSFRFFLFAVSIIPMFLFGTGNPAILFINLLPSFTAVVFFNYIHHLFGVSFEQFGFVDPLMYSLDIMIALAYLAFAGFILNQIHATEKFESKLYEQQNILEDKNKELSHMNSFINVQNFEMNAQADKLKESNDALLKASQIIERQKHQLENQNRNLEMQVNEKTANLSKVNEELIIINNELRQFSHTLSHNLKSPVATFQGLLNLIERDELNDTNKELLNYLLESVRKMQDVFFDMNEMLELRNSLYLSLEEVDLQKEMDEQYNRFYTEMQQNDVKFNYCFNGRRIIKTNGKRLNGILHEVISNAIKFRSDTRQPEITVEIKKSPEYLSLLIRDNGIGIDLEKYGNKLFYPYQRFHRSTCGKGLGLYLIKLQTESLGGQVSIRSQPDVFTEVEIKLKA